MAKTDITRQKIKSKISAIKKINDKPRSIIDNSYDTYKDDLESTNGIVKKGITNFTSKVKGATQNKKNIFNEIIDISDGLSGNDENTYLSKEKIIKYSKESANKALQSSKQIILDETKKSFFGGAGICNINTTFRFSSAIELSPKSFDIMNVLKVDPNTLTGKLLYENPVDLGYGDIKFNRKLYEQFDDPLYSFNKKDGTLLFTLEWDPNDQKYDATFTSGKKMGNFLDDYYNTIEHPDIAYVMKNVMQMTLQGDGTEPSAFKDGMKNVNRLCTKLLSICGNPATDPLLNNTPQQVTEDETDAEDYFDFDDVEGIDLDDEDAKLRNVLKFRDCSNFEIPINTNHMEDFGYLLDKKTLDENIRNTINKAATDAYEQSDGSINLDAFRLSLNNSFILNIPKALISSALSPKMIFPIALIYTDIYNELTVKDLMKKMSNLFYNIVKNVFWNFIKEFWKYVKKDLLNFVKDTATQIILNKTKKVKGIVSSLINILTQALDTNIGSCDEIFNAMLFEITSAMNKKVNVPIPGLLLSISDKLPGYSTDRAYMNVIERMESAGINTGPIYGTENKLPSIIKAILDGHGEEMDANSYVKIGMKFTTIPANGTNAYITPFNVVGAGKIF